MIVCENPLEMTPTERAMYWRGAIDLAIAMETLGRAKASHDVFYNLGERISRYQPLNNTDTIAHMLEESCRNMDFLELFDEPVWVVEETIGDDGIPILAAYSRKAHDGVTRYLNVWCKRCRNWHIHSGGKISGAADGHRVAHCKYKDSPYKESGYFVREVGEFPVESEVF